jgi:hypothetical protein
MDVPSHTRPNWMKLGQAGWSPRDSMGCAVFQDQLWILGGWLDSWSPCPRDVWSSFDGENWELALHQAPWTHADFPVTLVHRERLWVMGGWYNGRLPDASPGNEVWSSSNGTDWQRECRAAAWSPRLGSAAVNFAGKMWILGGVQNYYHGQPEDRKNDVWCSADGLAWELVLEHAPWAPRAFHQAVVFKNQIWLFGGGNYLPDYEAFHDVWCSPDGLNWTPVCEEAPWHPRLWFSALAHQDCLWIMGGWSKEPFCDWNDVWYSRDGRSWSRLETESVWAGRHAQAAWVYRDAIWIAGGHARPLSNEVWTLRLPDHWAG